MPPAPRARLCQVELPPRPEPVAQVAQQLAVLPPHDVGVLRREEPARRERRRHGRRDVVQVAPEPADGQHPGVRLPLGVDGPGGEVRRGQPHAHRVDAPEDPQGGAFVRDAVLRDDERQHGARRASRRIDRHVRPGVEKGMSVLGLHGRDQDVVLGQVELVRAGHRRHGQGDHLRRRAQDEPVRTDGRGDLRAPRQKIACGTSAPTASRLLRVRVVTAPGPVTGPAGGATIAAPHHPAGRSTKRRGIA